ncbi:hypothetical protein BpHYR1_017814 [Brachionus plicatilis]|uniref:Uncharacterized protein n=1 Tax=Brachionus plicatilis TaxID=10195 RepID=A0A3M7RMS1_BRAPC|nr:hypothetical protein BpHYR1_017814 [Brachionus plicatilis]
MYQEKNKFCNCFNLHKPWSLKLTNYCSLKNQIKDVRFSSLISFKCVNLVFKLIEAIGHLITIINFSFQIYLKISRAFGTSASNLFVFLGLFLENVMRKTVITLKKIIS